MNIRWRVLAVLIVSILFAAMATGIAQKEDLSQDAIKKPPKEDCEWYYRKAAVLVYDQSPQFMEQQLKNSKDSSGAGFAYHDGRQEGSEWATLYLACKEHSR